MKKRKAHSYFIDNFCWADVADMHPCICIYRCKGTHFLLCIIDIYSKYTWVISLKDRNSTTITNAFQKILDGPGPKPNKIWVDKGSKYCNRSMKSWLQDNDIEMYLIHKEGKSVVAERFIRTLKEQHF